MMRRWKIGDVTITRIVEQTLEGELDGLIPDATPERLLALDWLVPDYVSPTGAMKYSFHALAIETPTQRIIVDTCVGNDRDRENGAPFWHRMTNPFLDRLDAAGFAPATVDQVVCTHLHLDHVGWNTRREGERWVPTFPNARYLFGRIEYEHVAREAAHPEPGDAFARLKLDVFADAIRPVVEAGLVDLVETDHRLCPEISLVPTPGHTHGHVSVHIRSRGREAFITGDAVHHPCQLAHPEWSTIVDVDPAASVATRRAMFERFASDPEFLVIGTHWTGAGAGRIVADGGGFRLDTGLGDQSR